MVNALPYLALLPAAGFCYQYFATKQDEKNYPPPGDLIDVGGYQLHLQCQGKPQPGIPTVIVETGIWDSCQSWKLIQSEIAATTRICTYDRAGYGWSEQSTCPRTFEHMVQELKLALEKKGIHPPFIFVGHSLGGAIIRYYQSQYPNEVVGMIFVDAILTTETPTVFSRTFRVVSQAFSFLAHFGILRLLFKFAPPISANPQWTSTMQKAYTACHQAKVKTFSTCLKEWDGYETSFSDLRRNARSLKDIPVTIISRDPAKPMRPGMSKEAARKERSDLEKMNQDTLESLPHARFIVAEGSSHLVQVDRPDVVIDEIRRMANRAMI
ncbi:MAG: alpha/beta hydrolase [Chlamydiae bacterium]|nr:alpha/beta hydrolase [Chlamydiota bacterium]